MLQWRRNFCQVQLCCCARLLTSSSKIFEARWKALVSSANVWYRRYFFSHERYSFFVWTHKSCKRGSYVPIVWFKRNSNEQKLILIEIVCFEFFRSQFLFIPYRYVLSHDQYNVHEFMNLDQRTHEKVHIFVQQKSDRFVKHFSTSPYTPKPIISWEKTILNICELLSDICFHHFLSTHVFPLISSPVTFYRAEWFPEKFPIKSRSLSYARCPRESNFKTTN